MRDADLHLHAAVVLNVERFIRRMISIFRSTQNI